MNKNTIKFLRKIYSIPNTNTCFLNLSKIVKCLEFCSKFYWVKGIPTYFGGRATLFGNDFEKECRHCINIYNSLYEDEKRKS